MQLSALIALSTSMFKSLFKFASVELSWLLSDPAVDLLHLWFEAQETPPCTSSVTLTALI